MPVGRVLRSPAVCEHPTVLGAADVAVEAPVEWQQTSCSTRVALSELASGVRARSSTLMDSKFELAEPPDPWHGRQPKYERLVMPDSNRFYLETKLPSGEPISVQLGRLSFEREFVQTPTALHRSPVEFVRSACRGSLESRQFAAQTSRRVQLMIPLL
jgi:hypothetical protein